MKLIGNSHLSTKNFPLDGLPGYKGEGNEVKCLLLLLHSCFGEHERPRALGLWVSPLLTWQSSPPSMLGHVPVLWGKHRPPQPGLGKT